MTLGEFFDLCGQNPSLVVGYFLLIPIMAFLAMFFSKRQGLQRPRKYLYAVLIYLVCIPGIFAITLSVYLFLFERRSVLDTDLITQVLPILSMIVTIALIKRQVDLELVPGFDKLSGLITIISVLMAVMWIIDKTHIYSITFMPFYMVVLILVIGFLVIRTGFRRFSRHSKDNLSSK